MIPKQFQLFLALLFISMVALFARAETNLRDVSGHISTEDSAYYLIESKSQKKTKLVPLTTAVHQSLQKLKTHDYFSGTAESIGNSYILHSVDYVGLRRILGIWHSQGTLIEFESFSTLQFLRKKTARYNYALTPDEGSNWRVFLTDEQSVTLGTIRMNTLSNPDEMTLEIFDSTTGSVNQKVHLKKVKN